MRRTFAVLAGVFLLGAAPASRGTAAAEGTFVPRTPRSGSPAAAVPAPGAPAPGAPSSGPRDEAGFPRFAWPKLQVLEHIEASEIVEAGGVPVALRAVHVRERLQEVVQRLVDAFTQAGLYVPPGREQPQFARGAVMLTAVDAHRRVTYTAILQPQEDGTTTLYLGEANHLLRREPIAAGDFAPLPPGASKVLRVGGESARTMAFHVPLSAADVDAFYARALAQHGWRRAEDSPGVYTRPGEELQLIQEPGAAGLRAVVLVYRGRAVPPKAATPGSPPGSR